MEALQPEADHLRSLGYAVKMEVEFGDPAQRIVQYASDEGIGLIAMATHGRSGLSRLMLGSVAERVLRSASVPVLLLRPDPSALVKSAAEKLAMALGKSKKLRMVAATDGVVFGQRAVKLASELQPLLVGDLTVVVIASEREGAERAQQVMVETAAMLATEPKSELVPLVGYPDEVLLKYLETHPTDLLIIGAFADRGAGGVSAVGPTAHRIVQEAPTSVLLVKGHPTAIRRVLVCAAVEDEAIVTVGAQFAQAVGAKLDLLHVMPASATLYLAAEPDLPIDVETVISQGTRLSSVLHEWERKLQEYGFDRSSIILQSGSVQEMILQQARQKDYDVIVVGSESSPGHFPGSIANAIVRYAEQSVLLVRIRTT
jgi:nucleotide-binding universal stress UspA family protein